MHSLPAWKWIDFATLFLSLWIILSIPAGYLGILTPLLGIVAFGLAYWGIQKIPHTNEHPSLASAGIAFILVVLGLGIIFFGMQGGYDLSADSTPSMATQLVTNSIPFDYQPYFQIPFFYQLGLPAIASQLTWTGASIPALLWLFAVVGIGLAIAGMVRIGKYVHPNPAFLAWIPIVFLMTRLPFYNVMLGEYPWMLALGLGLMAIGIHARAWWAGAIVFAAAGITHPYIAFLCGIVWIAIARPEIKTILRSTLVAAILASPIFVYQVIPFLLLPKGPLSETGMIVFASMLSNVFLVGLIPCVLALKWGIKKVLDHESFSPRELALVALAIGGILASFAFDSFLPNVILGTKLPTLVLVGVVLAGSLFLAKIVKPTHAKLVSSVLVVAALVLLVSSPSLQQYAHGSKATLAEARFASQVYAYDSAIVPTLFLSEGAGKMAQYSKKIPADPRGAHFMLALQLLHTDEANALRAQSDAYQDLFQRDCDECVADFLEQYPMKYVVVNTAEFPALNGRKILHQDGSFVLYSGNAP